MTTSQPKRKKTALKSLLLRFLLLTCFQISSGTYVTRCEANGDFPTGSASVTCKFPKDLSETKASFCVYRYESNHTELVLLCHWMNGKPACYSDQGASLPESVSYQFTTSLRVNKTGEFSCETLPPDESRIDRCNFVQKEIQNRASLTKSSTSSTGTTVPTLQESEVGSRLSTFWYISVAGNVLLIVTVAACIIYIRKRITRRRSTQRKDLESESAESRTKLFLTNGSNA